MAYFDTALVTDIHVKDLVKNEDLSGQLAALDDEIRAVCISKGVPVASIPVDANGRITSAMLKRYATFWLYFTILHDFWGASGMDSGMTLDIYKAKLGYYEDMMVKARLDLTADNILEQGLDRSSYVREAVVY